MRPLWLLRTGITIIALVVAGVHVFSSIKIDAITLALLMVAALPWLQSIFKSVELPGGFKLELQQLQEEVKDAAGAAQSAERKADLAVASSSGHARVESLQAAPELQAQLELLARDYDTIRRTEPSGSARTRAMTEVVIKMIDLARLGSINLFPLLRSEDGGSRLAAYAYLYARPHPEHLAVLVASVTSLEDKPFGQYWGILAIGRVVGCQTASDISATVLVDLHSFAERIPRGTDRDHELRKILAEIERRV